MLFSCVLPGRLLPQKILLGTGFHSLLRCEEKLEVVTPSTAAPNARPAVILTHLVIPGLRPLLFVLDLLHGFPLSQTFLGLAEEARDGVSPLCKWADSQLWRGAGDLVKGLQ